MEDELIPFQDESGQWRKCGSLLPPSNFVSSYRTYEAEHPRLEDSEIRKLVTDPNRVPARVRWGNAWIMDQGSHGSCNGYAAAAALARTRFNRGPRFQDGLQFSGAYIYSKINGGRDNGSALEDGMRAVQKYGACPLSLVPWNLIYPRQQPPSADAEAAKHKGLACWAAQTLQGWRSGLALGFIGIAAISAGRNYQRVDARGIAGADAGSGNHAVCVDDLCIVGGKEVYDSPGSWNLNLGVNGRVYVTDESFKQTFGNHTFYLIGSTDE